MFSFWQFIQITAIWDQSLLMDVFTWGFLFVIGPLFTSWVECQGHCTQSYCYKEALLIVHISWNVPIDHTVTPYRVKWIHANKLKYSLGAVFFSRVCHVAHFISLGEYGRLLKSSFLICLKQKPFPISPTLVVPTVLAMKKDGGGTVTY